MVHMATRTVVAEPQGVSSARWISMTFLGWCGGFVLAIALLVAVESLGVREVQFPIALGMGFGVGLLQARVLPPLFGGGRRWVATTALALSAPFMAADLAGALGRPIPFSLAAYVALGGILVGLLQWRFVRSRGARAVWWLAITPVGWLLAGSTVWINEYLLPRTPGIVGALVYVAVVLAGGLVLGAAGAVALRLTGVSVTDPTGS
jgi:hypothetical protein